MKRLNLTSAIDPTMRWELSLDKERCSSGVWIYMYNNYTNDDWCLSLRYDDVVQLKQTLNELLPDVQEED